MVSLEDRNFNRHNHGVARFEPGRTPEGYECAPELSKRFTARSLGRKLRREQIPFKEIFLLVGHAVVPQSAKNEPQPERKGEPGN